VLKEYAVDPACLGDWERFRYLIENFGVPRGRLLSEYPRTWFGKAYETISGFTFRQKQQAVILLKRLKATGVCKSGRLYDDDLDWIDNAIKQQDDEKPFHAVVSTRAIPEKRVLSAEELSDLNPLWSVQRTRIVPRRADDMAQVVSKFLFTAKHIIFVDPHFGPENSRYRRAFRAFLQVATQGRNTKMPVVEIHTSAKSTEEFFREECHSEFTKFIPAGLTVRFVRWAARDGGQPLHNRYILTDLGGVSFHHGLDEGKEGETDDVSLLDHDSYVQRWEEYAGENPAFDLAEEPFELVGT